MVFVRERDIEHRDRDLLRALEFAGVLDMELIGRDRPSEESVLLDRAVDALLRMDVRCRQPGGDCGYEKKVDRIEIPPKDKNTKMPAGGPWLNGLAGMKQHRCPRRDLHGCAAFPINTQSPAAARNDDI